MRSLVLTAAAAAVAAVAVLGSAPTASAHVTVVVQTQRSIEDIDANAGWLVWRQTRGARRRPTCETVIKRRSWATGSASTIFRCRRHGPDEAAAGMAIAGTDVVWTRTAIEGLGCCNIEFHTHVRNSRSTSLLDGADREPGCGGDEIGALAAHGTLAAYTKSVWTSTSCPGNPDMGQDSMTGGHVRLLPVRSGAPADLAGSPPAAQVALSTGRLALVPYELSAGTINYPPPPSPEVQVWSLDSLTRERTVPETGTIAAIAIRKGQLAVLVSNGAGAFRIDRFLAATGAADGSTPVPGVAQPQLALWRNFVVYASGHSVRAVNTATGRTHLVARIRRTPYDVLAVAGRAVWLSAGPHLSRISSAPIR